MASDIILNDNDIEIVENVRFTRTAGGETTILLDSNGANLYMGGDGKDGDIVLRDNNGIDRVHLDSQHGSPTSGTVRAYLSGRDGNLTLGGDGADGDLFLKDNDGNTVFSLDGGSGNMYLGGSGKDGDIVLRSNDGHERIHIDAHHYSPTNEKVRVFMSGNDGRISLGGDGRDGDLTLTDSTNAMRIQLNGEMGKGIASTVRVYADGQNALMRLGGDGKGGQLTMLGNSGSTVFSANADGNVDLNHLDASSIRLEGVGDLGDKISDLESGSSSDERLKTKVRVLESDAKSLDRLNGVRFAWKDAGRGKPRGEQIGLVAQQVQAVMPEAVSKDSKGYLQVNFDSIVALLVERVKDQQRALDAQGTRISLLEDRLARLEARK